MPSSSTTTFSFRVTMGYSVDSKAEIALNKACSQPPASAATTFGGMASSLFFSGTTSSSSTSVAASAQSSSNQEKFFVASASDVQLSMDPPEVFWKSSTSLVAVFVPAERIASCLEKHYAATHTSGSSFWVDVPACTKFAEDLLPNIHPSVVLESGCRIRGIVLTSIAADNAPAEIVLLEIPKGMVVQDLLLATNGEALAGDSDRILKILPVSHIKFTDHEDESGKKKAATTSNTGSGYSSTSHHNHHSRSVVPSSFARSTQCIPICPVCIHRIDPVRLGLPTPTNQQLCSMFCPSPGLLLGGGGGDGWNGATSSSLEETCPKQRFLRKWPLPSRCKACQVIDQYWKNIIYGNKYSNHHHEYRQEASDLFCGECSMHKTLWVCLTCGFVGCGRYSNKHSVAHFEQTRHPYSLELATLRIWDYCDGEYGGFVHRADLLSCPSSPPLSYPWLTRGLEGDHDSLSDPNRSVRNRSSHDTSYSGGGPSVPEKSSKKAVMIGDEYEVLLQSALEDQALHYEGEIASLRAELTSALVDRESMTPEEAKELEQLRGEIDRAKKDVDQVSKELLEAQAQEAGLRAASQMLLMEQQKSNDLLKQIQEEHRRETEEGKMQVEDLEQQIADLSANLRMRQQFSQSHELNNAQIFGTTTSPAEQKPSGGKWGKKKGRFFRK